MIKALNCEFPGCDRPSRARRLCHRHYKQQYYTRGENDRIYDIWKQMIERCYNPSNVSYKNYGARGIKVCTRWRLGKAPHKQFMKDMGERPGREYSLERKDNNGDYSPDNCVWTTKQKQARNTRANKLITFRGQTKCLAEWAEQFSINRMTITSRLRRGWTVERALTTRP